MKTGKPIDFSISCSDIDANGETKVSIRSKNNSTFTFLVAPNGIVKLFAAFGTACTKLQIAHNKIGAELAAGLAVALGPNTNCKELFFSFNKIDDDGATILANALAKNTTCTTLRVNFITISFIGLQKLFAAFGNNTSIKELLFASRNELEYGFCNLFDALENNTALTDIMLYNYDNTSSIDKNGIRKEQQLCRRNNMITGISKHILEIQRIIESDSLNELDNELNTLATLIDKLKSHPTQHENFKTQLNDLIVIAEFRKKLAKAILEAQYTTQGNTLNTPGNKPDLFATLIYELKCHTVSTKNFEAQLNHLTIQCYIYMGDTINALLHYNSCRDNVPSITLFRLAESSYTQLPTLEAASKRTIILRGILALLQQAWEIPESQWLTCRVACSLYITSPHAKDSIYKTSKELFGADKIIPLEDIKKLVKEFVSLSTITNIRDLNDSTKKHWEFINTHLSSLSFHLRYHLCQLSPLKNILKQSVGTSSIICFEDFLNKKCFPRIVDEEGMTLEDIVTALNKELKTTVADAHHEISDGTPQRHNTLDIALNKLIESLITTNDLTTHVSNPFIPTEMKGKNSAFLIADVNACNVEDRSALQLSILADNVTMAIPLLDKGAKITDNNIVSILGALKDKETHHKLAKKIFKTIVDGSISINADEIFQNAPWLNNLYKKFVPDHCHASPPRTSHETFFKSVTQSSQNDNRENIAEHTPAKLLVDFSGIKVPEDKPVHKPESKPSNKPLEPAQEKFACLSKK